MVMIISKNLKRDQLRPKSLLLKIGNQLLDLSKNREKCKKDLIRRNCKITQRCLKTLLMMKGAQQFLTRMFQLFQPPNQKLPSTRRSPPEK
jgi:hypothetical protein